MGTDVLEMDRQTGDDANVYVDEVQGFVNKYFLPKVALTLISVAALAGTYITMRTHGATGTEAVVRWLHFFALAALTGGTMWWGLLIHEYEAPLRRFNERQAIRFARVGWIALAVLTSTAPVLVRFGHWAALRGAEGLWWANVTGLVLSVGATAPLLLHAGRGRRAADPGGAGRISIRAAFVLLALTAATTAALDARLTFGPGHGWALLLRAVHLLAYSFWLGGAVWNIFVAGPAARDALSLDVVYAAALQLERFRWVVRFALPALLITGVAQALMYTGLKALTWQLLTTTLLGRIVLLKLGLIGALVGVFITCPLWRACSPIKGICEVDDLAATQKPPTGPAPTAFQPTHTLDNRGKGCAGFVEVRKELDALSPSDVLQLLTNDPISWWELPEWLEVNGYTLLERTRHGWWLWRHFRFLIAR